MIRTIFILLLTVVVAQAQVIPLDVDSTFVPNDTLPQPAVQDTSITISISKDSLDTKVDYGAKDSMRFDNVKSMVYLYGNAFVNYEGLSLKADYIEVNIDSSIALAQAGRDSTGRIIGIPEFKDGPQIFNAMKMRYNFKSKKGLVYEAVTQETDIYVRGTTTKFVGGVDSLGTDDMIFNKNAIFTTCDHPEPHYGVRSLKQKLVPNKIVVVGPSVVEIAGVPTPLVLPFAFFPLTKGKRSGLILPRDYEYSEQWGFGLRELGYYIPISDYMDTRIMGDIYFNGSWGVSNTTSYRKRYKYNGSLNLAYSLRKQEIFGDYREQRTQSMRIFWQHSQNNKSNPFHNFTGNVNFQINQFQQLNNNEANSALNNTIRSTITYRRLFPDKPYTLTVALNHSQNNNTRDVNISFPDIKFNMRRIQPFKKDREIAGKRWYDEIGITYNMAAKSRYQTKDSLLLEGFEPEKLNYGVKHTVGMNANYNVFKYLLFNTSVNYDEFWHFKSLNQELDPILKIEMDSIDVDPSGNTIFSSDTTFGVPVTDTIQEFKPFRNVRVSTGFSTKLFGTARFKGKIRGLRHIMTPSVSFNYSPGTRNPALGYIDSVDTDIRPTENMPTAYSTFLSNPIGTPNPAGLQQSISFRLENNFEAKYFSKTDSVEKNVRLLDKITLNTDYNFAKDSQQWNRVRLNTFTKIFNGLTTLTFNAQWDPYGITYNEDGVGRRNNTTLWEERRQIARFEQVTVNVATIFTIRQIADLLSFKSVDQNDPNAAPPDEGPINDRQGRKKKKTVAQATSLLDLFAGFRVNHTFNFGLSAVESGDTLTIDNHYINITGSLQISDNWAIRLGRIGYNFIQERITYPDVGFTRDLHCWTLSFNWQPVRGTYSMFIGVKPGSMDFLKVPYRKNNIDTFF